MSTFQRSFVIIATVSGGILAIGYIFFRVIRRKKIKKNKDNERTIDEDRDEKDTTASSKKKPGSNSRTPLEVTTSVSLELNKKSEFTITKQANFFVDKINEIIKEENHEDLEGFGGFGRKKEYRKYKDEVEDDSLSNEKLEMYKRKIPAKNIKSTNQESFRGEIKRKGSITNNKTFNGNNTILNIVNDLKLVENFNNKIKQYAKDNHLDNHTSIYLPMLNKDNLEEEINLNSDDGYFEEDDDEDLKDIEANFLHDEAELNYNNENLSEIIEKHNILRKRQTDIAENIETPEDLNMILFNKNKRKNLVYNIQTEIRTINDDEKIEIIKEELLLIILKYLYSELHSGLIELSDNFVEQRRYYFNTDEATYISIINLFLRKKEEFFLGVLSEIMSRLNISQNLLDNTFVYYMNYADQNQHLVEQIKSAYDKVYQAGIKSTIAPKNLNREKIKEILAFQCSKYHELIKKYSESENLDIIEVMVIDHTYTEYGYDREAIKSAMNKLNVYDSESFEVYLNKLEEYQKNAFLNI